MNNETKKELIKNTIPIDIAISVLSKDILTLLVVYSILLVERKKGIKNYETNKRRRRTITRKGNENENKRLN